MKKIYEYTNYEELLRDLKEKYGIPQYPYFKKPEYIQFDPFKEEEV